MFIKYKAWAVGVLLLLLLAALFMWEPEMNEIDDNVVAALNELSDQSDESIQVLISCREKSCDQLALELADQGVDVKQAISELDILVASITPKHIKFLESSEKIHSVELDQDVSTQTD